jgi:hypothetical protein
MALRRFFEARRLSRAAAGGLLGRRVFLRAAALWTSATSRARAASRFSIWVRYSRLSMISTPSVVIRLPARVVSRSFTAVGKDEAPTSKRSSTAVATLLTFCPPGPDARMNRSSISASSRTIASVIWIMAGKVGKAGHRARPERVVRSWNALDSERSGGYCFFLGFFFSFLIEVPFDIQPPWR